MIFPRFTYLISKSRENHTIISLIMIQFKEVLIKMTINLCLAKGFKEFSRWRFGSQSLCRERWHRRRSLEVFGDLCGKALGFGWFETGLQVGEGFFGGHSAVGRGGLLWQGLSGGGASGLGAWGSVDGHDLVTKEAHMFRLK